MKELLITTLFLIAVISSHAQDYYLTSPDGFLTAKISINSNASVELSKRNEKLLKLDEIDLLAADGQLEGMRVKKSTNQPVNRTVIPEIREKSASYPENYNELTIAFKSDKGLTFRLYNEGIAYRFSSSGRENIARKHNNLYMFM